MWRPGLPAAVLMAAAVTAAALVGTRVTDTWQDRGLIAPTVTPRPTVKAGAGRAGPRIEALDVRKVTGSADVALTFDDGPHATWTPRILDMLRAQRVKATFCLVGTQVRKNPALVVRIVREGHTLCNHSWNHDRALGSRPVAVIRADLVRTNVEIRKAVPGAMIRFFRQPYGTWTPAGVAVARELGMEPLGWDVDPKDWEKPAAKIIGQRVLARIKPGSIVLLHDGGGDRAQTLAACPALLIELRTRFRLVALRQ